MANHLSLNQIVAWNLRRARELRNLTAEQAAERLEPFLGTRWSKASFSNAESMDRLGRHRRFTLDDVFAFCRAFELDLAFFLTPPRSVPALLQVPDTWPEIRYGPEDATETSSAEQVLELVLGLDPDTRTHVLERVPARDPEWAAVLGRSAKDHEALIEERKREYDALDAAREALEGKR